MKKFLCLILTVALFAPSVADAGFRARQRQRQRQNDFNAGFVAGANANNNGHFNGGRFNNRALRAPGCR